MERPKLPEDLDGMELMETYNFSIQAAVRALIATHPDREAVRRLFDQLCGQHFVEPAYLDKPSNAVAVKAWAEILFQPPVQLQT